MFSIQLSKNVSRIFNKKIIAYSLNNFTRITSIKCQDFNDKKTWFKFYPDNNLEHIKNEKEIIQIFSKEKISPMIISSGRYKMDIKNINAFFYYIEMNDVGDSWYLDPDKININHCIDLLDCVSIIHKYGVVHNDLKPSNICLSLDGEVSLIDFEKSVLIKNENKKVRQYLTNYQSSDQYISIQSDYYSLSAIFFWYFFREDFLRYKLGVFKEEELNYSSGNYMKHILYVINLYSKPKAKDRPKNLELYYDLFKSLI